MIPRVVSDPYREMAIFGDEIYLEALVAGSGDMRPCNVGHHPVALNLVRVFFHLAKIRHKLRIRIYDLCLADDAIAGRDIVLGFAGWARLERPSVGALAVGVGRWIQREALAAPSKMRGFRPVFGHAAVAFQVDKIAVLVDAAAFLVFDCGKLILKTARRADGMDNSSARFVLFNLNFRAKHVTMRKMVFDVVGVVQYEKMLFTWVETRSPAHDLLEQTGGLGFAQ